MSGKTGTYIWDEVLQRTVKVSDDVPSLPGKVWFPKHGYKYFDKALNREFRSNTQKRDWMRENGIREIPQIETDKHRVDRCAEIVNTDRVKQGLKPKTVSELKGNV